MSGDDHPEAARDRIWPACLAFAGVLALLVASIPQK
jgi:hypothetical protein